MGLQEVFDLAYRRAMAIAAKGPQVLSEIEYLKNVKEDIDPVIIEDSELGIIGWRFPKELRIMKREMPKEKRKEYGITWRAWTMEPDPEDLSKNPWPSHQNCQSQE